MAYNIKWSPRAASNFEEICEYIARDSKYYAILFARKVNVIVKSIPLLNSYFDSLSTVINDNWEKLSNLNIALIKLMSCFLNLEIDFVLASSLDVSGKGSDLLLDICKKFGTVLYLSDISGRDYLKLNDFEIENIKVEFQDFHHPIYKQLHEPFLPCMSVIDLLFNHGPNSLDIIKGVGIPVMEEVFL